MDSISGAVAAKLDVFSASIEARMAAIEQRATNPVVPQFRPPHPQEPIVAPMTAVQEPLGQQAGEGAFRSILSHLAAQQGISPTPHPEGFNLYGLAAPAQPRLALTDTRPVCGCVLRAE